MKNKLFTLISLAALLLGGVPVSSQKPAYSKVSPYTHMMLSEMRSEHPNPSALRSFGLRSGQSTIQAFVSVTDESAWPQVEAKGGVIETQTGDIAIVRIPVDKLNAISQLPTVRYIEASQPVSLQLDSARIWSNANPAHEGIGLDQPYAGKGVIVGCVDVGFDFTHPTFYDSTGRQNRFIQVWDNSSTDGTGWHYTNNQEILEARYSKDSDAQTHGTHVLGIAAGSGYGTPYRGIAYESDLAVAATTLQNANIIKGLKQIFDYADAENKPCVVNYSLGYSIGPRDGTALIDRMIDRMISPGRILVASAGNFRNDPVYIKTTSPTDTLRTFLCDMTDSVAIADLWNHKPGASFSIQFSLYDFTTEEVIKESPFFHIDDLIKTFGNQDLSEECYTKDSEQDWTDNYLLDWGEGYKVSVWPQLYPFNGKYNLGLKVVYPDNRIDERMVFFSLTIVPEGGMVDGWGYNEGNHTSFFSNIGLDAYVTGNAQYASLGEEATTESVITVGSYISRGKVLNLDGDTIYANGIPGEPSVFSSFGPTSDGRLKPDICAPGEYILSAYNSSFLKGENGKDYRSLLTKGTTFNNQTYPWGAMTGTPMSAPYVTGSIALWLQANPNLSPEDIRGIFSRTAKQLQPDNYPNYRWGYGAIDTYAGLLDVLGLPSGNEDILNESPWEAVGVYKSTDGQTVHVRWAHAPSAFTVGIYTMKGVLAANAQVAQPATTDYPIRIGTVPTGIYLVRITTEDGTATRTIRL